MIYRSKQPVYPLNTMVRSFTYFDDLPVFHQVDRFIPNGGIELIINLTDNQQCIYDEIGSTKIQRCKKAWVSGIRTEPINIAAGSDSSLFVVEFEPGLTFPIFDFPMANIRNTVIEADAIFGNAINDLRSQIMHSPSIDAKFKAVETWLLQKLDQPNRGVSIVRFAATLLSQNPMDYSVDKITQATGVSNKHLDHLFKQHIGIPPKRFQRIHKLQRVLSALELVDQPDWISIAYDGGYYDQSHLIREFKLFTHMSPGSYMQSKGEVLNYIPIA